MIIKKVLRRTFKHGWWCRPAEEHNSLLIIAPHGNLALVMFRRIFESQNTQLMKMFTRGRTPSFLETTSFAYLLINEHFCLIIKHTDLNSERQNRGTVSSNRTLTVSVLSRSLNSKLTKLQTAPIWSTIWIASKLPAGLVRVHRGMISPL